MMSGLAKRVLGASSRLSGSLFEGSYSIQENFLKVFFEFRKMRAKFKIRSFAGGGFGILLNGCLSA